MSNEPTNGEDNYATFESRTCASCAVSLLVTPPRIQTRERNVQAMEPYRICRLHPPQPVIDPQTGKVQGISQGPVYDAHVCWHWKRPGTLPGD